MPELPEVETVVRGLRLALPGQRVTAVRLGKTDFMDDPAAIEQGVPGSRIVDVRRHGKFLVLDLARDSEPSIHHYLLIHLGMTGQLSVPRPEEPVLRHTHAFFSLENGRELRYTDIRRFGRIAYLSESAGQKEFEPLGLDPLEMSAVDFCGRLNARRARIKSLLLDQRVLRGVGNIYADESLWQARLHPARSAARLSKEEGRALRRALQRILRQAIRLGGSSVRDYVNAEGQPGEFQIRHRVYQRTGKECYRCGNKIRRMMVGGRSSHFCPRCQRAPRSVARQQKKRAPKLRK